MSTTYAYRIQSSGKHRKRYIDHTNDRPKLTCFIHGPGHSSDECKFLVEFGSKYSKIRYTKDCGNEPVSNKKTMFSMQEMK